jgi:peptidoglycan/xylan/chitin deacetylase (PgdA/CDA1 family)
MTKKTGIFTISLDFEMIWGTLDRRNPNGLRQLCEKERFFVVDRLLTLFAEFDISATWCIVGHLFLDRCSAEYGLKHPEIVRPAHSWAQQDWFSLDPCATEKTHPVYYGRTLVEKIRNCRPQQEIGCHTFSHVIFGDEGCSRATAETELEACVNVAREMGIEMRSFAFPRNRVGHLPVLRSYGFTSFRGPEPRWYESSPLARSLKRFFRLMDILTARTPATVTAEQTPSGLWNIPASMLFTPAHGIRRYIPVSLRVDRAFKGLEAAARQKRIFHLWFHPTDLAENMEAMLSGLRQVLEYSARLRSSKELTVLPMGSLVPSQVSAAERHDRTPTAR